MREFAAEWVVLDIEGTLTPTSQVHVVLYDYARPRLGPWIDEHGDDPVVADTVARVRELAGLPPGARTAEVVAVLHSWMAEDKKIAPLKTLQGLIWERGYAVGDLTAELFDDVAPALRVWHDKGLTFAVFSSGSVPGQVAFFSRTSAGDLTSLVREHFDTVNAGPKRAESSYRAIAARLAVAPSRIVFLSDVPAELDPARAAGWQTVGVARPGEPFGGADFGTHPIVASLAQLTVVPA